MPNTFDAEVFDADVFDSLETLWNQYEQYVEVWAVIPNETAEGERGP